MSFPQLETAASLRRLSGLCMGLAAALALGLSSWAYGQDCGVGDVSSAEACLGDDDDDTVNGGCNSDPDVFESANLDGSLDGTVSTFLFGGAPRRDTDWYLITQADLNAADADGNGVIQIRSTLSSEFDGVTFFISFEPDCDTLGFPGNIGFSGAGCAGGDSAVATLIIADHPAGVVVFVSSGMPDGTPITEGFECATGLNDYLLTLESVKLPTDCAPGAGPCGEPNGSPGCEDPECCALVCEQDPLCCILEWDQTCADIGIGLGCAPLPCPVSFCDAGVCTLSQSQNSNVDSFNQIACGNADGTTENAWARCYNLVEEGVPVGENLTINSVTFGVQQATIDGINVDVILYLDCDGCPPSEPNNDATVLATQSLVVNMSDVGNMITVNFPAGTVVPAGSDLIVEIANVDDGTEEPFFAFRTMSNDVGQCGPTYLRAADCGFAGWVDLADIGDPPFVDTHMIQSVSATVGGVVTVECAKIPEACGKGAGACDEPNGSPGCEDVFCCAAVCEVDPICCILAWDQTCVDIAIGLGCVAEPCDDPGETEGVPVPASEDFDSYADGFLLDNVNGWSGWDDVAGTVARVTSDQARSLPHSIEINAGDDPVQQYLGAFCEGQYVFTIYQYIPSEMVGLTYFIMLNTYDNTGGPKNWSVQVNFDNSTGLVHDDGPGNAELPIINDEWVEIRLEIDLDTDSYDFFYGGTLLYTGIWSDHISGDGERVIDVVDLFANNATPVYYDDLSLVAAGGPKCPWDLDGGGFVGAGDLLLLLADWGNPYGAVDLLALLADWGDCP